MHTRSPVAWLVSIFVAVGACAPLPLYGQYATHYLPHGAHPQWAVVSEPGWPAGAGAGALLGAQVSAMNPLIRCYGRRSFTCGPRFDPRPTFAGALIGGVIGHALSFPYEYAPVPYYGAAYAVAPGTSWSSERTLEPPRRAAKRAPSIADDWQQLAEPHREGFGRHAASRSQFVEDWQRFFEPSVKGAAGGAVSRP